MLTSENLVKQLKKANYVVRASITKNGCSVEYPERLFPKYLPEEVHVFVIEPGAGVKIISSNKEPLFVEMPDYAFRLFIITKIIYYCVFKLKYEIGAISFSKNGEEILGFSKFTGNIVGPESEEDEKKENALSDIWIKAYSEGFSDSFIPVADESGVKEGYEVLQHIFEEN
jgi:hypothetical protein